MNRVLKLASEEREREKEERERANEKTQLSQGKCHDKTLKVC